MNTRELNMMGWVKEVLRKYATFEGRARRKEFWYFALFCLIAGVGLAFIDVTLGTYSPETGFGLLSGIFGLALLIPYISVTVRRLHDTDRSGWWWWISLIPLVGGIVLLVFMVLDSTPGANRYGPNPKGVIGAVSAATA
jgi:uncharacterized membrane protein YhaH (DUF805 family)